MFKSPIIKEVIQNSKGQAEYVTHLSATDSGKPIVLSAREYQNSVRQHEMLNALGFEIDTTSLTAFSKTVTEQKFWQVRPSDYLPVRVGDGAWAAELITYRSVSTAGDFEAGMFNTGAGSARMPSADTGVDSISVKIKNWNEQIEWTLPELQFASRSGNWDLVTSKEKARKVHWDLGIQKMAFVGATSDSNIKGLLTQSDINANTTLITKLISSMTAAEFNTFVQGIMSAYRVNCNYTAYPTHFIMPETDYNGLVAPVSESYPMITKLQYLLEAFKTASMNPNFKILPLAYAAKANNSTITGLNKNRYTLLNYAEDTVRMDIPVDYTSTAVGTSDNYNFKNVGFGQFTGAKFYRPLEGLYFDWS